MSCVMFFFYLLSVCLFQWRSVGYRRPGRDGPRSGRPAGRAGSGRVMGHSSAPKRGSGRVRVCVDRVGSGPVKVTRVQLCAQGGLQFCRSSQKSREALRSTLSPPFYRYHPYFSRPHSLRPSLRHWANPAKFYISKILVHYQAIQHTRC